jgi:hypothetical protein
MSNFRLWGGTLRPTVIVQPGRAAALIPMPVDYVLALITALCPERQNQAGQ